MLQLQLTFKDINELVEQNVQLRSVVRHLSEQIENKELEFKVGQNKFFFFYKEFLLGKV